MVPSGTPANVVAALRSALHRALRTPELKAALEHMGFEPVDEDPDAMAALLKAESERFKRLMNQSGIRLDTE